MMPMILDFNWDDKISLLYGLNKDSWLGRLAGKIKNHTLKLLWTSVSSKSSTRHFLPACCGAIGGNKGLGTPS